MWWLDSETQTIRETQPLPPRQVCPTAVTGQVCSTAVPVKDEVAEKQTAAKSTAGKKPIGKCTSPLIDLLTPDQERANRILSQVQCGHEAEIERLVADVGSLEKSIRQSSLKMESQQAIIEDKEFLLRVAEQRAESLQCSLAEFDGEVQRMDLELSSNVAAQLASQLQHEKQAEALDYGVMVSEHRIAELITAIHGQIEAHRQNSLDQEQRQKSVIAALVGQLAERDSILNRKDQEISNLKKSQDQLAKVKRRATTFQLEIQRTHASRKALAEEMRRQRAADQTVLQQKEAEIVTIGEQLSDAEKRVATWQLETQRSHASRRALAEETRRHRAVHEADLQQSQLKQKEIERKQQVAELRTERFRSENSQLKKQLHQETKFREQERRIRESETSKVQDSLRAKSIQVKQIKASIELRDCEIIGLKNSIVAMQDDLSLAWECSKDATTQLQLRDAKLQHVAETEDRFLQLQADQVKTLQDRIDVLVNDLDAVSESSRLEQKCFDQTIKGLASVIDQLEHDHHYLTAGLNLSQQTNTVLLIETAKSRAQLSARSAKEALLIERYEERLREANETIETLTEIAQPSLQNKRAA